MRIVYPSVRTMSHSEVIVRVMSQEWSGHGNSVHEYERK